MELADKTKEHAQRDDGSALREFIRTRHRCDTCRYQDKSWYDEPCDSCVGDKWEAEQGA